MLQVRKEAANALTGIGEAAAPEIVVEDLAGGSWTKVHCCTCFQIILDLDSKL